MKSPFSFSKRGLKFSGELEITRDAYGRETLQQTLTQLRSFGFPLVAPSHRLTAFSDESLGFDDLTIESSADSVILYGSIALNPLKPEDASRFATILHLLAETEQILEKESLAKSLPAKLQTKAPKMGGNPFA